jgi:2-polyprenyl-3-methyl-5-hydroxy-6-metoxy-1,4-benzoquinol methylase
MFHVKQVTKMVEIIIHCPVCDGTVFSPLLKVKDYFLSQEEFSILSCGSCGFRFVNPRPDKSDIGRYYQSDDYISHDAGKKDFLSIIYKFARRISIRRKYGIVSRCSGGRKILDIGCGTAEFLAYCQKQGWDVTGIEPNEKARLFAQTRNLITTYEQLDALADLQGTFHCITMWHVLEHIHDLNGLIIRVRKLLAPAGMFIIAVPNCNSWDAQHYNQHWAAYDVPRHLYHFTKDTILKLATRSKMQVVKIYPQKLDAYYVSMLSEKYKSGKPHYFKSVVAGFWSNLQATRKETGHSSMIFILTLKNT